MYYAQISSAGDIVVIVNTTLQVDSLPDYVPVPEASLAVLDDPHMYRYDRATGTFFEKSQAERDVILKARNRPSLEQQAAELEQAKKEKAVVGGLLVRVQALETWARTLGYPGVSYPTAEAGGLPSP